MSIFKKLFNKPKDTSPSFYTFPVTNIERETAKAVTLTFDKPQEGFSFKSGQYLTLRTTINGAVVQRAYSLCNLPNEDILKVTIKETPDGYFSAFANQNLEIGDLIDVMSPMGNFTFEPVKEKKRHIVAFAGGSGITPIFSILQAVLAHEKQSKITLFYGNRTQEDIIFKSKLEALQTNDQCEVVHVLSDEQSSYASHHGYITDELVKTFAQQYFTSETDAFYLCGPGAMVQTIQDSLVSLEFDEKTIHTELFTAPVNQEKSSALKDTVDIVSPCTVHAKFSFEEKTVQYTNPKQTILDAVLDAGLKVPFSCLNGVCSSCSAKLKKGSVNMDQNFALEKEDIANNYILTCQSYPTSDELEIDWDDNRI